MGAPGRREGADPLSPRRVYCLDSWAAFRLLEDRDRTAHRVRRVLADQRPHMSWVNLGEVFYKLHRDLGPATAEDRVAKLRPSLLLDVPGPDRVMAAARIKATHQMSYADAFAVATARACNAVLLTGDPEILEAGDVGCRTEDLRRA